MKQVPISLLSVIIPCYNELNTIESIVEEVNNVDLGKTKIEIIIVDDFSNDGTRDKLKNIKNHHNNVKVFYNEKNKGKGACLKKGFSICKGEAVIVQDADREYDPRDYSRLLKLFIEDRADIVFGSRFQGGNPHRISYISNRIANKFMSSLSALLNGLYVSDIHTCYIMFRGDWIREKSKQLRSNRFGFNPEIVAKIAKEKSVLRICEIGISYYGRTKREGKKIGFRDGVKALWEIVVFNLV